MYPSRNSIADRISTYLPSGLARLAMMVLTWLFAAALAPAAAAQDSATVPAADSSAAVEVVDTSPLGPEELEALVGPVALYPDDLLAVVLPAATYPLQIVEADRYLRALEDDPSLAADEDWDESVVALLNYPEVVAKLSEDLDWTWDLGRAVMDQEEALLAAVERFRRKAHAAGNLDSDERQRVDVDGDLIAIRPAHPDVIYVPYYDPNLVRLRHATGVYHYYPRPCPVYYYPYPVGHHLMSRRFWGVTSAFSIGWRSRHLHFHLLEHRSHPYFGHAYAFRHYRYFHPRFAQGRYRDDHGDRHGRGERWRPERRDERGRPLYHDHPDRYEDRDQRLRYPRLVRERAERPQQVRPEARAARQHRAMTHRQTERRHSERFPTLQRDADRRQTYRTPDRPRTEQRRQVERPQVAARQAQARREDARPPARTVERQARPRQAAPVPETRQSSRVERPSTARLRLEGVRDARGPRGRKPR